LLDLVPNLGRWRPEEKNGVVAILRAQARPESHLPSAAARACAPRSSASVRAGGQRPLLAATIWATTASAISSGERPPSRADQVDR
jgi:hypothetical protein